MAEGEEIKGNADCHIPSDKYREGWERVFGQKEKPELLGKKSVSPGNRETLQKKVK